MSFVRANYSHLHSSYEGYFSDCCWPGGRRHHSRAIKFYDIRKDESFALYEYRRMVRSHKSSTPVFGKRLRAARMALDLPQDRLGVLAGLDEGTASARISRYESGIHEPPIAFAERLARILHVPAAYFYAEDDALASLILDFHHLPKAAKQKVLTYLDSLK